MKLVPYPTRLQPPSVSYTLACSPDIKKNKNKNKHKQTKNTSRLKREHKFSLRKALVAGSVQLIPFR